MDTIIAQNAELEDHVSIFMKQYRIGTLLKRSNFHKSKGISCATVFRFLLLLVFTGKNLYRTLQADTGEYPYKGDTIYRFLNNAQHNWRKFLLLCSSGIIKEFLKPLTSEHRDDVLIIDDSLFSRNRSKAVELLARVYDHVEKKYRRGFRMLTIGWSDGATFLPVAFSLLSSEDPGNRYVEMNADIDKRTNGYMRRRESIKKATDILVSLLKQVRAYGISAKYVLCDSWFAYPKVIKEILQCNLHTICMLKDMPTLRYRYNGSLVTLGSLYRKITKKRGRAKILASVVVDIGPNEAGIPILAKIVFVRDRNRKRQWLALLSTDITLSDEEIVRLYGKRWDIEVFFRMCKSYLKLAREFASRSYDAMVAHTTIVFCRYIMLAIQKRIHDDPRTLGVIFFSYCEEIRDTGFAETLALLMELLQNHLQRYLPVENIREFISIFIASLPLFFRARLQFLNCES
jgi:DDE superfamily endonuclease